MCVVGQAFRECSALIGTGRHFVGLYCHMPRPILPLIRAAITATHSPADAHAQSYEADPNTLALSQKLGLLHAISIPSRCLVRRSNGARSRRGRREEVTGTSSLSFYSTHQDAVSLDNVKFGAKQLKAGAVGPDGEGSHMAACRRTHYTCRGMDVHPAPLTHSHGRAAHPPTWTRTRTFTISMQAISSESAGLNRYSLLIHKQLAGFHTATHCAACQTRRQPASGGVCMCLHTCRCS